MRKIAIANLQRRVLSEEMPTLIGGALQGLQKLGFAFILRVYGYPGRSLRVFVSARLFERSPEI